jgi:hypothetical protein
MRTPWYARRWSVCTGRRCAAEVLARQARGRTVAIVGHFPFIEKLRPLLKQLWVIELRPVEGEHRLRMGA